MEFFGRLKKWMGQAETLPMPRHLYVYTNASCQLSCHMCYGHSPTIKSNLWNKDKLLAGKNMDFDTFKYLFSFLPSVEELTFSGWGEPLVNPDIFKMIFLAYEQQRAIATIITNGLLLENRAEELLSYPIKKLLISLNGYSPDSYTRITGMDGTNFKLVYRQIKYLIAEKRARNALLPIWLSFIVDTQGVFEVPHMIHLAKELQVDGVELLNYLPADPAQKSEQSLYSDRHNLKQVFEQYTHEELPFTLVLPRFLDRDMSKHHNCRDPFESITIDGDGNASTCSKGLVFDGKMGKMWDPDFWYNNKVSWLRKVHTPNSNEEVPRTCQGCPNNLKP